MDIDECVDGVHDRSGMMMGFESGFDFERNGNFFPRVYNGKIWDSASTSR